MKTRALLQGFAVIVTTILGFGSLARAEEKEKPLVMASVGDSISVAFDAWLPLLNRHLSWSAGDDRAARVNSHYHRLSKTHGKVVAHNIAVPGAPSSSVVQQMATLRDKLAGTKLDYLTLMVGANDVCSWPVQHEPYLERYKNNLREALDAARGLNPEIKVLFVPTPNLAHLYRVGKAKGCGWKWRIYPMCNPLFRAKSDADRLAFEERANDLNDAMAEVAAEQPDIARFSELRQVEFDGKDLSWIDCFHPSTKGQNVLSDVTWQGGWFAELNTERQVP